MTVILHRSERLILTVRRVPDCVVFRADVWSFEPSVHSRADDDHYIDVRTGSIPVPVVAPFGSAVVPWEPPGVDWPEFRHRLRVYWDSAGLPAVIVWQLAAQGVRGFRLGAGVTAAAPVEPAPERAVTGVIEGEEDELFALEVCERMRGRARR